jgi:predicted nucleotidyltransferase
MNDLVERVVNDLKRFDKVMAIILFGSHAKGTSKPCSDIDIAVISEEPDVDLEAEVSSASSKVLDVVNYHRLPLYIQYEVLKHGKELFVRNQAFLTGVRFLTMRDYLDMEPSYTRMNARILT